MPRSPIRDTFPSCGVSAPNGVASRARARGTVRTSLGVVMPDPVREASCGRLAADPQRGGIWPQPSRRRNRICPLATRPKSKTSAAASLPLPLREPEAPEQCLAALLQAADDAGAPRRPLPLEGREGGARRGRALGVDHPVEVGLAQAGVPVDRGPHRGRRAHGRSGRRGGLSRPRRSRRRGGLQGDQLLLAVGEDGDQPGTGTLTTFPALPARRAKAST